MGEGNLFFSKSLAQVGTPSCCSRAKGNKPPKNGYGGKFSLIRGEAYKNTADGEREREKIVFHSVTEVSKSDLCLHPAPWQRLLSSCTRIEGKLRCKAVCGHSSLLSDILFILLNSSSFVFYLQCHFLIASSLT